ncbi:MAG: branched-chain amino acid ABC transporter permease [Myxococcaceae bacterium]
MSRARWLSAAIFFALLLSMPLWLRDAYLQQIVFRVVIFAVLGMAWNLLGGYAGQLSLGHVAYFGIGAYSVALFHEAFDWNPWLGMLAGVVLACLAALLIGGLTFRLRGPYFVLSTIATAEILRLLALNLSFTHGAIGMIAPSFFSEPNGDRKTYYAALPLLAAAFALTSWTDVSRFGYSLRAIRENEDTAMAVGINPAVEKLKALLLSAALVAAAGALYAGVFQFIGPDSVLSIDVSVQMALIAMLGGAATVWGPMVGAVVLTVAAEGLKAYLERAHTFFYGVLLVLVVLFLPGGLVSIAQQRWFRRRPAGAQAS